MTAPPGRLRRLAEELEESGLPPGVEPSRPMLVEEIDHALRPHVHERRVASGGVIVEPLTDPDDWTARTDLHVTRSRRTGLPLDAARRFADGLSSWLLRRRDGRDEWILFDRPAGSERDLVVLADAANGTIVQRHPSGSVRVVGSFGVLRWDGLTWHHEPPLSAWIDSITADTFGGDRAVVEALLEFAVHDLGSNGIGALLIYRATEDAGPEVEDLFLTPPPLRVQNALHLAPLRHALAQLDGAAVFDVSGVLRQLGVRLVPSSEAEEQVDPLGGTRHTSARRYSFDDPDAMVVAVSEDGPVTVLRNAIAVGRSPAGHSTADGG